MDFLLKTAVIFYSPERQEAVAEAEWLAGTLRSAGIGVDTGNGWDSRVVEKLCPEKELAIALGGDGTIIRVVRLASVHGTPVLGVNLGRFGFLADVTPGSLRERIPALIGQEYWIENRTMLDVRAAIDGKENYLLALNEVALARGLAPKAIYVDARLNDKPFMTYTADGVLVSTATGSTAYSLAAGGPILFPESTDLLLTPVAPHLHISRSVVLPGSTTVTLRLASDRPAVMSVDGASEYEVRADDEIVSCRSETVARFAHLSPSDYFYRAIAERLR